MMQSSVFLSYFVVDSFLIIMSFVSVDMYRSCIDVLGLCARDNRSNAVDTSGVETSVGIRSSICVGNRSGSSNRGSSSNWSSSIGVGDWSSWLGRGSNVLDCSSMVRVSSIRVSSISYGSSGIGDWCSYWFHMNIRFSFNFLMNIGFSSNLSSLYRFFMGISLSDNILMHICLSSNSSSLYRIFMNISLSSNIFMNIRFSNNIFMDIRESNRGFLWSWGSNGCRNNGQRDKELHFEKVQTVLSPC